MCQIVFPLYDIRDVVYITLLPYFKVYFVNKINII